MTKGYVDIPEGQISYRSEGSGKPLLLLHQTPWSFHEYSLMIPILATTYRVIAVETLGYGYSDDPPREYEVEDFARSVVSFLDALNIAKASIVGNHTGSIIAAEVASAYPDRVDKLILAGLPYRGPKDWEPIMKEIESQLKPPTDDGSFLIDLWKWIRSNTYSANMKLLLRLLVYNLDSYTRAYDAHLSMARYDIKRRLPLIQSPTLALSGSNDLFIDELQDIEKAIPCCQTKVIEGTGLGICLEKPGEFASIILDFLGNP